MTTDELLDAMFEAWCADICSVPIHEPTVLEGQSA